MRMHLRSYTPSIDEYEFKAYDDDGNHEAMIYVTHKATQTDITVELLDPACNTPDERVEYMLLNGAAIMQAASDAQKD